MKLSTLRKSAQRTTRRRGHTMRWRQPFGDATRNIYSQMGACRRCGMEVTLHERAAPNQIDIGGEAVALDCKRRAS